MSEATHHDAFSGGCQCGLVRFTVAAGPAKASVCHCRMCQRATGNAFAPLIEVPRQNFSITGEVREWASSSISVRGFCPACGTPLYLADNDGEVIELMAGALDRGTSFDPLYNYGVESRMGWTLDLPDLPDRETVIPEGETLVSYQSEET